MASKFAGSITSNLKFTAKVPLLMKATSNDEKPTQGYDLQEISRISKSSLPNCQSLLSFLLGRLEKTDPRIKFKVLHLMKYLVINGHSEFRSQLRRNAEAVKQTVSFQGALDRVHGDGLNVKVQQAASDLEKLLFDVDNPDVEIICKSMLAPDESSKIKEQGFGYTRAPEIKKEASFMDALMKVKKSGSEIFNTNKAKSKVPPSEYGPMTFPSQPQYIPVDLEDSEADDEEDEICDEIDCEMDSAHYYERKLVHNITAEGGMTKIPSKEMLRDFVNKSLTLELPVILDLLDERIQNSSPNVQLKSLCVVEYLLRSNRPNIPRQIDHHCSSIHLLAESQDQTVQAKANKIALAVASCLKQEEEHTVSRAQVVPPSYGDAKELPRMKNKSSGVTEHKAVKNADFDSLFSGMNVSTQLSSPVSKSVPTSTNKHEETESDSSILNTGTSRDFGANCKSVEVRESLIDLGNTVDILSTDNSDIAEMLDRNKSNSKQNSSGDGQATSRRSNVDTLTSISNTQTSNNLNLMSLQTETSEFSASFQSKDSSFLGTSELKTKPISREDREQIGDELNNLQACGTPLQGLDIVLRKETDKRRIMLNSEEASGQNNGNGNMMNKATAQSGVLNSNNVNLLNWQSSLTASNHYSVNSTQNTEDLLLNTEQRNPNSAKTPPRHINPHNPNSDLLSFQPAPRAQALPGCLVLPTNNSSVPRRPFPKDMKSEVDGFDFIRKSSKADAFSFVSDEIQASKTKPN